MIVHARRALAIVGLAAALTAVGAPLPSAHAAPPKRPRTHLVFKGQTLGKIAARYQITVDALRNANGLEPGDPIKPGQRLHVPPLSDKDGQKTRERLGSAPAARPPAKRRPGDPPAPERGAAAEAPNKPGSAANQGGGTPSGKARVHVVARGNTLGKLATRYHVTVEAIQHANELGPKDPITRGQKLVIPAPSDTTGAQARDARGVLLSRGEDRPTVAVGGQTTWAPFIRTPARAGYLTLVGQKTRGWKGTPLTPRGNVRKLAHEQIQAVLATSDGHEHVIDHRLIQLLVRVSDTFGGRPIHVVSGFRLKSPPKSRHRSGRAIDFTIPGVPNTVLRDYVKTFDQVGVGYYPNSHFVHLDVRKQWTYWIDYSGPGQPPRYAGFWTRRSN